MSEPIQTFTGIGPMAILDASEYEEIKQATAMDQQHLIVKGFVDFSRKEVVLFRPNKAETIVVPFSFFMRAKTKPDFNDMSIIDYGNTVKFGECEAESSTILYACEPAYKAYVDSNRIKNAR